MSKEILLKCFLYGDESQSVFPVRILENYSVGILKNVIKAIKMKSNPCDASQLTLYKGNIPFDDDLGKNAAAILDNATPLLVSTPLSNVFEGQPHGSVHIIVQLPGDGASGRPNPRPTKRPRVSSTATANSEDSDASTYTGSSPYYVQAFGFEVLRYRGGSLGRLLDWHKHFWGNPLPQEHTTISESDSNENRDGDGKNDDLLPDPILDMGDMGLLIRAEYLRVYAHVEQIYNVNGEKSRPPAVVVTGQPGIGKHYCTCLATNLFLMSVCLGKTKWAYYVLRRRLGEAADVLWYQVSRLYLFCSEGVLEVPADFNYAKLSSPYLWTLIDSAVAPNGIPINMNAFGAGIYPIYITYPKQSSWSSMDKRWSFHRVLMNPWTKAEIAYATNVFYPKIDTSEALQRYDSLGPTPRLCLDYGQHQIALHLGDRERAMNFAYACGRDEVKNLFIKLLSESRWLSMGCASETICLVQRVQGCPLSDPRFTVTPISNDVANKLALCLERVKEEELLEMWKMFSYFRDERGMTDLIFEAYVQRRFRDQIDIQASPMHRLQHVNSRWHASFNTNQHASAGISSPGSFFLQINVGQTIAYSRATSMGIKPNIYYVPQSGQQAGLNSFIIHRGILFMFQCTGCEDHDIKDGLVEFLASCQGVPSRNNWRFVFIISDDLESFTCPASIKPTITGLQLHTARIPMS
ncbi:hypothetical protein BD410DRAFT_802458 [Rickenella mellea]|uniref:Crinkler effector protein N-terminal domain-containing protein n=1 Tax=Rickenella mellea TaxID=50990 RepID=A0A4Y7Q8N3_9AGAM|nr:hypothetical protein BD410DRAFT_802458 [Rickenella mellea]